MERWRQYFSFRFKSAPEKLSGDVIRAFQAGLTSREEAREERRARGEELGACAKIEPAEDKTPADPV